MPGFYNWQGEDLLLRVTLQPRASNDAIVGPHGDALKIRVTAPPVEGKANRHLQKFLAAQFAVPVSQVELRKGHSSRSKLWCIRRPRKLPAAIHTPN